jgi:DNA-binding transcriptional regulator GbsR (MarR family)
LAFDFEKNGLAFDELVETFCASKSSISASINFLLNANLIKPLIKLMKERDILSLMMIL